MDVSIIIPAYNSEQYIEKCLMSCIKQDLPHDKYEVIVVDDGSIDNTKQVVRRLQEEYACIKYFYQSNSAQGAARNNGLSKANGKYIWFVDSDDWIEQNCLSLIIDKLEKENLTAVMVGHETKHEDRTDVWYNLEEEVIVSGKDILKGNNFFISPTYGVWKRSYLLENDLRFRERMFHEDTEFYPRLFYNATRIGAVSKICYHVYPNPTSTTRSINPKRAFDMVNVVKYINAFVEENITEEDVKQKMIDYMALNLNVVLFNTFKMERAEQRKLGNVLFENRAMYELLLRSRVTKYKVEGCFFRLFPKHVISIYKFMQMFNAAPGGINKK